MKRLLVIFLSTFIIFACTTERTESKLLVLDDGLEKSDSSDDVKTNDNTSDNQTGTTDNSSDINIIIKDNTGDTTDLTNDISVADNTSDVSSDISDLSGDSIPITTSSTTTTTTTTTVVPKRSEVINEDYVLDDKVLIVTGADLYLNSEFIRSVIPSEKFPQFARDENLTERQQYVSNKWIDNWAKYFYEKCTDEDKQYFIDNIDDFAIDVNIVTTADPKTDNERAVVSNMKEFGDINSYIFNSFGLAEATVSVEVYPAKDDMTSDYMAVNPYSYRKLDKKNRSIGQNEFVVHAGTLGQYFNSQCKYDELQNLSDMFGANLDINRLRTFNEEHGYEEGWNDEEPRDVDYDGEIPLEYPTDEDNPNDYSDEDSDTITGGEDNGRGGRSSSSTPGSTDYDLLQKDLPWFIKNAKNGDVVSRGKGKGSSGSNKVPLFYGNTDHTGLFNREKFLKGNSNERAVCMLASYPSDYKIDIERPLFATYEKLEHFLGGKYIAVNRSLDNKGDKALKKAEDHFYGSNGQKNDYDPWCCGVYISYFIPFMAVFGIPFLYTAPSEYLKITDASYRYCNRVNYCSYISWYGYIQNGIELNSDIEINNSGYMIVPDDIVNSGNDQYTRIWISDPFVGCNFFYGGGTGHYEEVLLYEKQSNIVYTEKNR